MQCEQQVTACSIWESTTYQDSHDLELTRTKLADGVNAETAATETITRVAVNFMVNGFRFLDIVRLVMCFNRRKRE